MKKLILFIIVIAAITSCQKEKVDPRSNPKYFDPQDWHEASLYEYNQFMDSTHIERNGILWELDLEAMICTIKRFSAKSTHGIIQYQYEIVYPENGESWTFRIQNCNGLISADFTYQGNARFTVTNIVNNIGGIYTEEGVIAGPGYPELFHDDKVYANYPYICID